MNIQTTNTAHATYHVLPTTHKGFVTGCCMVAAGKMHVQHTQRMLPGLLAQAMGLGTKKQSEEAFNQALEAKGILLNTSVTAQYMTVHFTCLSQDLETVLSLIAEQLNEPLLDSEAIAHLKHRVITRYEALKDDTSFQASSVFTQLLYPNEHIAYQDHPDEMVKLVKSVSAEHLKSLQESYTPLRHARWIIVGDVDAEGIVKMLDPYAYSEGGMLSEVRPVLEALPLKPVLKKVIVKDKQSVDIRIGHMLPIDIHHPDYWPLRLAIDALGGSFSARLMRTVRDEDGLTYNVGSKVAGFAPHHGGHWMVYGSFSPKLLDKGISSIHKQLDLWYQDGISKEELQERKLGMVGRYQVMLSDAENLVDRLAANIENGYDIDYLYTFPEKLMAVTLEEVNAALKKHIDLKALVSVYAGSIS